MRYTNPHLTLDIKKRDNSRFDALLLRFSRTLKVDENDNENYNGEHA